LERSTKLAIAGALGLTVGALIFILIGDGIIYLANLVSVPSGAAFGSSLVDVGYGIIALLVIIFVAVVGYLVYRHSQSTYSSWSGF
jgi:hypothetical protein